MRNIGTYLFAVLLCGTAWAQNDGLTATTTTTQPEVTVVEELPPAPAQAPEVVTIPAAAPRVVEQPKTVVESSPLVKSRAEQLREARGRAEIETEQKIVEKLEESRMEDERRRSERLFGDRFKNPAEEKVEAPAATTVTPVQQQVVPVQTVEDNSGEQLEAAKTEIIETVRGDLQKLKEEEKQKAKEKSETYVGALAGGGVYPDLVNVDSNEALGFVVGNSSGRFVIEGSYVYSNYFVSDSIFIFKDMDQHNFMFTAKYNILTDRVRPQIGGAASYTQRNYTDVAQGFNGFNAVGAEYESTAFDVGFVVALDVMVSENFIIGVDYRYMTNLTHDDDFNTPLRNEFANNGVNQLIEDSDYQIFSVNGKFTF